MEKSLLLNEEEFETLYELVSDTIDDMDTWDVEDGGVPLSEYPLFFVFNKLNRLAEEKNSG